MGRFDGAKDELRSKLKLIFENNEFMSDMSAEEDAGQEFQYTGDVTYNVKIEDDGEYREYYVSNEDGDVIEIFTDEMAEQDGRIPASVRQEIVAQAASEAPPAEDEEETEDVEDVVDADETDEEDEEAEVTVDVDVTDGDADVEAPEGLDETAPVADEVVPPEGDSMGQELPPEVAPETVIPENNHNQRVSLEEEEDKEVSE